MRSAVRHGTLTLLALLASLPLVDWIEPNTGAGATLLVVIVLLVMNVIGGLLWRPRGGGTENRAPTDY